MPERIHFDKTVVEAIPAAPAGQRRTYYDDAVEGFALRVTDRGRKTWILQREINRRTTRIRLGAFPEMGVGAARKRAKDFAARIQLGEDPRRSRDVPTLGEFFDEYLDRHAKPNKKTWRTDEDTYKLRLSSWKSRPLDSITKADVRALHQKIGREVGRPAANKMLTVLGSVYSRAEEWGAFEGPSPVRGVRKFRERPRERFLSGDELRRFLDALEWEYGEPTNDDPHRRNPDAADFFYVLLLTGARKGNVLAMRWEQLDLQAARWSIPDSKSGEPVILPLIPAVVEILRRRRRQVEADWVFPGRLTGHLAEPKSAFARVLARAGIDNLRMHDLRRTFGSHLAMSGVSLPLIARALGQSSTSATPVYARLLLDSVREVAEKAGNMILHSEKEKP